MQMKGTFTGAVGDKLSATPHNDFDPFNPESFRIVGPQQSYDVMPRLSTSVHSPNPPSSPSLW